MGIRKYTKKSLKEVDFKKPKTFDRFQEYFSLEREIWSDDYFNSFENYGQDPLIHFIYFNNLKKEVIDEGFDVPADCEDDKKWIKSKKADSKKGYLRINNQKIYFDVLKKNILLLVYMGVPLLESLKPNIHRYSSSYQRDPSRYKNIRKIIYQRKNVDLEKIKQALKWRREYDLSIDRINDMDKPFVFHDAIHKEHQRIKPYSTLNDLLKNERK